MPGLALRLVSSSSDRQGHASSGSTRARALERCPACWRSSRTRTGRRLPAVDKQHQDDERRRSSPFLPLHDARSTSAASPSRSSSPRRSSSRATRPRSCESSTRASRTRPISTRSVAKPTSRRRSAGERARRRRTAAYAAPPVRHEPNTAMPLEHHNPMEMHASTVVWDGDGKHHGLRQDAGRPEQPRIT